MSPCVRPAQTPPPRGAGVECRAAHAAGSDAPQDRVPGTPGDGYRLQGDEVSAAARVGALAPPAPVEVMAEQVLGTFAPAPGPDSVAIDAGNNQTALTQIADRFVRHRFTGQGTGPR